VDDGISFGEVEEAAPEGALRPDRNRHYAVAMYGQPQEQDLPIFVDLDVLLDMEDHAQSDTSVELGGVLLGGHFEDEQGRPFVLISDSLRAQHYESTKGSFKFTHDTWSAITRERDEFPPDLQMVGWYHTHPDWGVFLSGMDMFICDNFFNKKLDVAYVIDPCRGDRGMFQWTGDAERLGKSQRVRRTGGFFVTASRFRAAELEYTVGELCGAMPVTTTTSRGSAAAGHAPVIHLHQPQSPQPPWQGLAIAGALALQLALVALIAFKTLVPPAVDPKRDDKIAAAIEKLGSEALAAQQATQLAKERARAQTEILDQVVGALRAGEGGSVSKALAQYDQAQRLSADVDARDAKIRELQALAEASLRASQSQKAKADGEIERLELRVASLEEKNKRLDGSLKAANEELATYKPARSKAASSQADGSKAANPYAVWWYVGGAVLAAVALVGGVWWIGGQMGSEKPEEAEEPRTEEPKNHGGE
jgi:proteasome lid subunit RPN8/RPN11